MAIAGSLGAAMDYTLPAAGMRALAISPRTRALRGAPGQPRHDLPHPRLDPALVLPSHRAIRPARLAGFRSGDLLARIHADIDTLDDYYVRGIVPAIVAVLAGACIVPFLSRYDPRIAWIDGMALLAAGIAAPLALACLASRPGRESVARSAELRASIVEEVEGMAELVVLGAAIPRARRMAEVSVRLDSSQRKLNSLQGIGEASIVAAGSLAVAGAALVLLASSAGRASPRRYGHAHVFMLASFETILPLPTAIQKAGEMAAAARRLFELLDAEPAVAMGRAERPPRPRSPPLSPSATCTSVIRRSRSDPYNQLPLSQRPQGVIRRSRSDPYNQLPLSQRPSCHSYSTASPSSCLRAPGSVWPGPLARARAAS